LVKNRAIVVPLFFSTRESSNLSGRFGDVNRWTLQGKTKQVDKIFSCMFLKISSSWWILKNVRKKSNVSRANNCFNTCFWNTFKLDNRQRLFPYPYDIKDIINVKDTKNDQFDKWLSGWLPHESSSDIIIRINIKSCKKYWMKQRCEKIDE
jgi:hypothetical protein